MVFGVEYIIWMHGYARKLQKAQKKKALQTPSHYRSM